MLHWLAFSYHWEVYVGPFLGLGRVLFWDWGWLWCFAGYTLEKMMGVIKNVAYLIILVDLAFLTLLGLSGRWFGPFWVEGGLGEVVFSLKLY